MDPLHPDREKSPTVAKSFPNPDVNASGFRPSGCKFCRDESRGDEEEDRNCDEEEDEGEPIGGDQRQIT